MTAQEIFYDVRALLDEWSEDGILIPEFDVIDMQMKAIRLINMAQKELYGIGDLYATYEFSHYPHENLTGMGFTTRHFVGDDLYFPNANGVVGAGAYYFEIDGTGTVTVEELTGGSWVPIATVNSVSTSYESHKANISPSGPVRIKATGSEYFAIRHIALFPYNFTTAPDYKPFFKVTLPDNFKTISKIVKEGRNGYEKSNDYHWEGRRDLYVNWNFQGNMRVVYRPVPVEIDEITDTLEIDDITAGAITYYVAARIAPFENKELVQYFETKYMEKKMELLHDDKEPPEVVEDVIFGGIHG